MTLSSMTGYAAHTLDTPVGNFTLEIRSVNSRFLDLQFRIHDDFRSSEPLFREALTRRLTRGKVECRLNFSRKTHSQGSKSVDPDLLSQLHALQQDLRLRFPDAAPLSINELLRWPGVLTDEEALTDDTHTRLQETFQSTLDAFVHSREKEGAALRFMLEERIDAMLNIVAEITPMLPNVIAQFQQKIVDRLQEALGLAEGEHATGSITREEALDRIRQEVTLYGIRIDVAEELNRLKTHLQETRDILKRGGQVGKRLDFMMQELNREANTLGSKAAIKEWADASMQLKLLIEQMREQIQNLE